MNSLPDSRHHCHLSTVSQIIIKNELSVLFIY